ncbi:beta-galactosidase trimerization domain-containing protein, partial [bacterium]|nr:beta-galactosidase trimerization domain-containing protein [bacterium]
EHHSSHLTFNPKNDDDEQYMDRVLHKRHSTRETWPQLRTDCDANPVIIDGVRLSELRQIDGRTGLPVFTGYRGHAMCFNNPFFRKAYFQYLETVYATGVDGIMTDDVQWFGIDWQKGSYTCTCPFCRQKFTEKTGYHLPEPDKWDTFFGDYNNPRFLAWIDFKLRSVEEFHQAVKDHYESLGLKLLRPNYVSGALNSNPSQYCLENLPALDWLFQESIFSSIIRYSWPGYALESQHRFAVGRRRNIPPMDMFYPDRWDSMRFCWALAQSWGVLYLATPEGKDMSAQEKMLRNFEKQHANLLRQPQRLANIGIYDSRRNREMYGEIQTRTGPTLESWANALYLNNIVWDLFQTEELERLENYNLVVLPEIALLSENELNAFRTFVQNGGTLVWTSDTGSLLKPAQSRSVPALAKFWGLKDFELPKKPEDITEHTIGRGKLLLVSHEFGKSQLTMRYTADRWVEGQSSTPIQPITTVDREGMQAITALVNNHLPEGPAIKVENAPDGVLVTGFRVAQNGKIALHLVNTAGTLTPPEGTTEGTHEDPIPFPKFSETAPIICQIHRDSLPEAISAKARAHFITADSQPLPCRETETGLEIDIPTDLLHDYLLVEIG